MTQSCTHNANQWVKSGPGQEQRAPCGQGRQGPRAEARWPAPPRAGPTDLKVSHCRLSLATHLTTHWNLAQREGLHHSSDPGRSVWRGRMGGSPSHVLAPPLAPSRSTTACCSCLPWRTRQLRAAQTGVSLILGRGVEVGQGCPLKGQGCWSEAGDRAHR
jgi:hypothetical protein